MRELPDHLAEDMREAFDRAFAAPPSASNGGEERGVAFTDFLAIGVHGDPYALRLGQLAGLHADRAITPLPTAAPGLLGLAGFRGVAVPVYDLGVALGLGASTTPRWMVLIAADEDGGGGAPVALAFDRFDGHLRTSPGDIVAPAVDPGEGGAPIAAVVRGDGVARPIVDIVAIVRAITRRATATGNSRAER